MNEQEEYLRIKQLFKEIYSAEIRGKARNADDEVSWTRQRNMPLHDILTCTLAKKGLSTVMELRQYFRAAGKAKTNTVNKLREPI